MRRRTIGFDRKIQLDWLDAVAAWVGEGQSLADIRFKLEQLLEGKVAGGTSRSARDKTITVLLHIWKLVPQKLVPLRNEGLIHLRCRSGYDRLPLHWGMCLSTYPFFRDLAAITGRLLSLQGTVALSQLTRRMAETWGERSTVARATQRVTRSLVEWGALTETDERGVFSAAARLQLRNEEGVASWLVEASIAGCEREPRPLRSIVSGAALFPFDVVLSARELASHRRIEMHHQNGDEVVVLLREDGQTP